MTFIDPRIARELAPTGRLRASLNLANAVLARSHSDPSQPAGLTVDLSKELARRLQVEVEFLEWHVPGDALRAVMTEAADVGYLAVDTIREREVNFTQPYLQIEGCYLAPAESALHLQEEVDAPGIQVLAIETSAYDLYLSRSLKHAELVRLPGATEVLEELLTRRTNAVAAGVKQALVADMQRTPGLRLLGGHFMAIQQGMVLPRGRSVVAREAVGAFLQTMVNEGFIANSLKRHGIEGATVLRQEP